MNTPPTQAPSARRPTPESLSLMDPPDRPGGLSPDVAGAVSVSRSDATRRTYSGQWRQFVAWADDAGIPWLLTAPVDVAEYLTALVGAGRRSCNGAARRSPFRPRVTSGSQKTGCPNRGLALGLGPAWLGARWAADVAERSEDTGPRLLCAPRRIYLAGRTGEPGLTGRMGVRPGLNIPYPTGPTNCLARTRSTGSRRGSDVLGRGCPTPAGSPHLTGSR